MKNVPLQLGHNFVADWTAIILKLISTLLIEEKGFPNFTLQLKAQPTTLLIQPCRVSYKFNHSIAKSDGNSLIKIISFKVNY